MQMQWKYIFLAVFGEDFGPTYHFVWIVDFMSKSNFRAIWNQSIKHLGPVGISLAMGGWGELWLVMVASTRESQQLECIDGRFANYINKKQVHESIYSFSVCFCGCTIQGCSVDEILKHNHLTESHLAVPPCGTVFLGFTRWD